MKAAYYTYIYIPFKVVTSSGCHNNYGSRGGSQGQETAVCVKCEGKHYLM